ncbi:MAG: transposase [Kiritimatiellae bacterium]|nr:transposase [Kiritimatiellia bacterium]
MPDPKPHHKHLAHLPSFTTEPIVFFTVVTARRQAVLACETAHHILRTIWQQSAERNGWWVGDYLLMPDHVHFFAQTSREADSIPKWVQMWKSVSSHKLLRILELVGPFWQKDYFDRYLRSDEDYSQKWAYVEANPVRAGLVTKPEDWPYRGRIHPLRF